MRDDLLDRLRRENPVPETMPVLPIESILYRLGDASHPVPARPRLRRSMERFALGLSVLLVLAVAGLAVVVLGGHSHKAGPSLTASPQAPAALQNVRTLKPILASFAVLRRPQTRADRSWAQANAFAGPAVLPNLTRLVATLENGDRIFLVVVQWPGPPRQLTGTYSLFLWLVNRHGNAEGVNAAYLPRALQGPPPFSAPIWASIVPDGVATVQWKLTCTPRPRSDCATVPSPVSVSFSARSLRNNVAAADIRAANGCWPIQCRITRVTWYDARGRVIATREAPSVATQPRPTAASRARLRRQEERQVANSGRRPIATSLLAHFKLFRLPNTRSGPTMPLGDEAGYANQQGLGLDLEQVRFVPLAQTEPPVDGLPHGIWVIPGSNGLCLEDTQRAGICGRLTGPGAPDSGHFVTNSVGNGVESITGVVPDSNRTVSVVLANRQTLTVPVTDNTFSVEVKGRAIELISENAGGQPTTMRLA